MTPQPGFPRSASALRRATRLVAAVALAAGTPCRGPAQTTSPRPVARAARSNDREPSPPATTTIGAKSDGGADVTARDPVAEATREYHATGVARAVVAGSFITFPYGHAQPTLTCAVLRACVVELQPGEVVLSRIAGDTERWEIVSAPAGADGRTTLVVVKPHDCDVTTNLVLATDRRVYDLTLDSPPCTRKSSPGASTTASTPTNPQQPYARHVRFYYPDETVAEWTKPQSPAPAQTAPDPLVLNFHYRVTKDRKFPWAPAQVFDDGARVYVKLPDAARHADAPALFALEADGTRTLVNYSVVGGDTYVTDRLFDRAVLVVGAGGGGGGGRERKVLIERESTGGGGGGGAR